MTDGYCKCTNAINGPCVHCQLAAANRRIVELENFNLGQFNKLETANRRIAELEKARDDWKYRYETAFREGEKASEKLQDANRRIADLLSDCSSQGEHHRKQIQQLQSSRDEWRGKCKSWEAFSKAQGDGLKKVADERNRWRDNCRSITETWQKNYSEEWGKNKELQARIEALTKTVEELESFRKLSGEYATLSRRDAIREENKRLRTECDNHKAQIKGLQADLSTACKTMATYQNAAHCESATREALSNQLETFRKENERLAAEHKQVHEQNNQLFGSVLELKDIIRGIRASTLRAEGVK